MLRSLPIYVVTGKTEKWSTNAAGYFPVLDTGTRNDSYAAGGALPVTVITDITGLTAWKDYIPVMEATGATAAFSLDGAGYIPIRAPADAAIFAETDPYFANVSALLHLDGTNGSTTFTDVKGNTWTARSSTALSTAQSKFGTASLSCPAAGGITTADSAAFSILGVDNTTEFWGYPTANTATMAYSQYDSGSGYSPFRVEFVNGLFIATVQTAAGALIAYLESAATVSLNAWSHVAFTKSGTTYRLWVNGVKRAEVTNAGSNFDSPGLPCIGGWHQASKGFVGYLDEFRFTKGVARYTADFTPRTSAFPDA